MNPKVDHYLAEGCGRCSLGGTPDCRVHTWAAELRALRSMILDCGLVEEVKWSVPVYTYNKHNILLIGAFKEYCSLGFLKGVLLKDDHAILEKPGENSQSSRVLRIANLKTLIDLEPVIKAYIFEAIDIEKAGIKVAFKTADEYEVPIEFQHKLNENAALKSAFYALTPGRQRSYLLHFTSAKQSKTRDARIEKCVPLIFSGKGFNEY